MNPPGPGMQLEQSTPLVDRDVELEELESALTDAITGRGRLMLIAGEAGMGKTSLAEVLGERAGGAGVLPLWGRAWENAGAPVYWPWTQLLRRLLEGREPERLRDELGASAQWLAEVLPELNELVPNLEAPKARDSDKARFGLFDAVWTFLCRASGHTPLLVVLDDLHAADAASLLLLEFASRGVASSHILVVGMYQPAAARRNPELEKLIVSISRAGKTLELRPFDEEHLRVMVEQRTGRRWPKELVSALYETTEGNPLFTSEVARLIVADRGLDLQRPRERFPLPDTVRETVRRRFEPLSPQAIELLETAAVIGREFRLLTLRRASGIDDTVELIDEAVNAELIADVPGSIGRFRFTHSMLRDTLYAGLDRRRRIELHRAVGETIEELFGAPPDRLVELAYHFAQAAPSGDAERALHYALEAAHAAMRLYAYEQAADLFELAAGTAELLPPDPHRRAELLLELGQARAKADHVAAREVLIEAAEAGRAAGDPRLIARAGLCMRAFPRGTGVLDEQPGEILTEALERLGDEDSPLRCRLLARLGVSLYYWPGTEERRAELAEEAVAMARRLGDGPTLAYVLSNAQLATWGPDTTERDLAWMEELLALLEETGDDELELAARSRQIDFLIELGRRGEAESSLAKLALTVADAADPRTAAYVQLHQARLAIADGRYDDAERHNSAAAADAARLRDPTLHGLAAVQLFSLRWPQGRLAELEPATRQVAGADATPAWPAALALLYCEVGKLDEARRELERLAAHDFRDLPRYNGLLVTLALLSQVALALRDLRRAELIYDLLLPFSERNVISPQAAFLGPVARYLALLAAAREDWDAAGRHLGGARAAAERMHSPPTMAQLDADEAQIAERRGAPARPQPQAAAPSPPGTAVLRREGDVWAFEVDGRSVRLRDSKGIRLIARLLANPGAELAAAELAQPGAGELVNAAGDAGSQLDAEAKRAYKRRMDELAEELEEAESFNDPERAARAREELDFIAQELAGAVGLGGRDRKAASNAERARVSVTKAIRATIRRVTEHDAELGRSSRAPSGPARSASTSPIRATRSSGAST